MMMFWGLFYGNIVADCYHNHVQNLTDIGISKPEMHILQWNWG